VITFLATHALSFDVLHPGVLEIKPNGVTAQL
jgi:hypothetical protein